MEVRKQNNHMDIWRKVNCQCHSCSAKHCMIWTTLPRQEHLLYEQIWQGGNDDIYGTLAWRKFFFPSILGHKLCFMWDILCDITVDIFLDLWNKENQFFQRSTCTDKQTSRTPTQIIAAYIIFNLYLATMINGFVSKNWKFLTPDLERVMFSVLL